MFLCSIDGYVIFICFMHRLIWFKLVSKFVDSNGKGPGLERVAPIPIPPRLLKTIPSLSRLTFFKLLLKFLITLK